MAEPKKPGLWRKFRSLWAEEVLERTSSAHNPMLEVSLVNGHLELNTQHTNYSFGALHLVFAEVFREYRVEQWAPKRVLLLGVGAGSVPRLFAQMGQSPQMTGVEIDPEVIRIGNQYFNLESYPWLRIVKLDAVEYVSLCVEQFDLIIVDLFIDHIVPPQAETINFLQGLSKLLDANGLLLYNRMIETKELAERTQQFGEAFQIVFPNSHSFKTVANRVYIADARQNAAS